MSKMSKGKVTPDQVAAALRESRGMFSVAARKLGISRQAVAAYCKRHPGVEEARADAAALAGDIAELKLMAAVERDEAWATQFYLRTQGRTRGYGDELKLSTSGTSPRDALRHVMTQLSDEALAELEQALSSAEGV